jgi:predicted DNA-binding transcriptional regulator YafY
LDQPASCSNLYDDGQSGAATRVSVAAPVQKDLLRSLQSAIVSKRPIKFRYYLRRDRKHRIYRVDPLGVIFHRFAYLACIDHKAKRDGIKTFRLAEVDRVEALEGLVNPPANFDLDDFTQQSFGIFHGGEALDVVWRFSPSAAEEASKFAFHPTQTAERQEDGSLIVRFRAKSDVEMCWELMTWGKDVEILAPDSLKDTYTTLVDELVEAVDALHTV